MTIFATFEAYIVAFSDSEAESAKVIVFVADNRLTLVTEKH